MASSVVTLGNVDTVGAVIDRRLRRRGTKRRWQRANDPL
jgi:hypothetical protein